MGQIRPSSSAASDEFPVLFADISERIQRGTLNGELLTNVAAFNICLGSALQNQDPSKRKQLAQVLLDFAVKLQAFEPTEDVESPRKKKTPKKEIADSKESSPDPAPPPKKVPKRRQTLVPSTRTRTFTPTPTSKSTSTKVSSAKKAIKRRRNSSTVYTPTDDQILKAERKEAKAKHATVTDYDEEEDDEEEYTIDSVPSKRHRQSHSTPRRTDTVNTSAASRRTDTIITNSSDDGDFREDMKQQGIKLRPSVKRVDPAKWNGCKWRAYEVARKGEIVRDEETCDNCVDKVLGIFEGCYRYEGKDVNGGKGEVKCANCLWGERACDN